MVEMLCDLSLSVLDLSNTRSSVIAFSGNEQRIPTMKPYQWKGKYQFLEIHLDGPI